MTREKKLLQNLYKLIYCRAKINRLRANDVGRSEHARGVSHGLASAYEYLINVLQRDELTELPTDDVPLPAWMQSDDLIDAEDKS